MDGNPLTVADLKAEGAVTALMVDALKPNLVMTAAGTPAFVHAGPLRTLLTEPIVWLQQRWH